MNKKERGIKKYLQSPGVKVVLALAIPIIIILILIMIYVLSQPETIVESRLVIDNFEVELPDVPSETRRRIEERLYSQVELSGVGSVPEDGAVIREGSVDGFTIQELHVGDFIVDIDSVKQSYIAEYFYGSLEGMNEMEREASATLYCIEEPELVKYPDFRCKANRDFVKPDAVSYLLPKEFDGFTADYTYSLSSKSGYAVVVEYDPSESVYMSGRVEAYKTEKMNELKEYLKKAGVDPDAYEYIEKFKIVR